ncbi:MAG TPA: type II secretion system F family protein [Candidatus Ozemobacteraceae bacterium]|nr:type II secretion system F family protein [Candidatus Ozemobacteraceae bacterium]
MLGRLFPLSQSERLRFLRQFYVILQASLPLPDLIRRLAHIEESPVLRDCLRVTGIELERGASLTMIWCRFPHLFPDSLLQYLRLGEESGQLAAALQEYLDFAHRADQHRLIVWSAGAVVLAIAFGVGFILYCSGTPLMTLWELATPYSLVPIHVSINLWFSPDLILLALAVLWLPTRLLLAKVSLKITHLRVSRLWLGVPALGAAFCKNDLARFLRAIRIGLVSGLPIASAGRCAAETVENRYLADELGLVVRGLQTGLTLSQAFSMVSIPMPCLRLALEAAEEGGELDVVLAGQADVYVREAESVFRWATTVLEPLAGLCGLAVMGGAGMLLLRLMTGVAAL